MKHIRVNGSFTEYGYSLARMALVGDNGIDETRNTVFQVLRLVGKNNIASVLLWDDGNCLALDDGTLILI